MTASYNPYGFEWGPIRVERTAAIERRPGKVDRVLRVIPKDGKNQPIEIYISPTGRSIRVFRGGKELK